MAFSNATGRIQKARRGSKVNTFPLPLPLRLPASRRRSATAARFAARHRANLACSAKFSRASEMHNRMLNSRGLFSLVYRLQLWSIRGTIHLENDDS